MNWLEYFFDEGRVLVFDVVMYFEVVVVACVVLFVGEVFCVVVGGCGGFLFEDVVFEFGDGHVCLVFLLELFKEFV